MAPRSKNSLPCRKKNCGLCGRDVSGGAIIPTLLWINEKGFAKLDIALARGKKMYDKRESIKAKDNRREMARGEIND